MKSPAHAIPFSGLICCLLLMACSDQGPNSIVDAVEMEFVSVSIGANMMPTIGPAPDPVGCQIDIVLRNNSSKSLSCLSIPFAEVLLSSTGEAIGIIGLHTDWAGDLPPHTQAPVTLLKTDSLSHMTEIPCRKRVYMKLSLVQPNRLVNSSVTKDFDFGCVY